MKRTVLAVCLCLGALACKKKEEPDSTLSGTVFHGILLKNTVPAAGVDVKLVADDGNGVSGVLGINTLASVKTDGEGHYTMRYLSGDVKGRLLRLTADDGVNQGSVFGFEPSNSRQQDIYVPSRYRLSLTLVDSTHALAPTDSLWINLATTEVLSPPAKNNNLEIGLKYNPTGVYVLDIFGGLQGDVRGKESTTLNLRRKRKADPFAYIGSVGPLLPYPTLSADRKVF